MDTSNATGASELYARHGMDVHHAVAAWETALGRSTGSADSGGFA
ncbi:hypothetical protein [Streptomyces sp. NBC_00076]